MSGSMSGPPLRICSSTVGLRSSCGRFWGWGRCVFDVVQDLHGISGGQGDGFESPGFVGFELEHARGVAVRTRFAVGQWLPLDVSAIAGREQQDVILCNAKPEPGLAPPFAGIDTGVGAHRQQRRLAAEFSIEQGSLVL